MSEPPGGLVHLERERAILRTVLYSDIFDYPLTPGEIAHYLISIRGSAQEVTERLEAPVWLNGQIARVGEFVTIRGRESLVDLRRRRGGESRRLWRRARLFVRMLAYLPFIRMVAVTGALSVNNSLCGDDVDLLIVALPGRVWLGRAFSILVVYAARPFGVMLCPNYVISEAVLELIPRNLFVARELVQMVPLYGLEVYRRLRKANRWVEELLPNANAPLCPQPEYGPGPAGRLLKRASEFLLSGRLGDRIDRWEMERKLPRFVRPAGLSDGAVVLDRDHVKGHFNDHGARISREFERRLAEYRLAD